MVGLKCLHLQTATAHSPLVVPNLAVPWGEKVQCPLSPEVQPQEGQEVLLLALYILVQEMGAQIQFISDPA